MTENDKKTRTTLISEIKDCVETYPDFLEAIRKKAIECITEQNNTNDDQTQPVSQSQPPLFDDTQSESNMETDEGTEMSGIKRKNIETETNDNEPRTRIVNNTHEVTKNVKECLDQVKKEILSEVRDIL